MDQFKKINSILEDIEDIIDEGTFEITDAKCRGLYHDAKREINSLNNHFGGFYDDSDRPMGQKDRKIDLIQKRFQRLCRSIETPEQFIQGERDAMFPNGEDEDEW